MVYQHLAATASSRDAPDSSPSGQNHDRIQPPHSTPQQLSHSPLPDPEDGEDNVGISVAQKMLSAVAGSVLTSILVTPLDVVRVRLQSQPSSRGPVPTPQNFNNLPPNLGISACCREVFWVGNNAQYCVAGGPTLNFTNAATSTGAECAVEETQKKTFTSTFDGLRKIARNEGPRTLWRGLSPTLVMAVPANVIYFAGYDWLRTSPKSPLYRLNMGDNYTPLVAGSTARVLAAIAVSPIEMFRTRMQAAHSATTTGHFRETLTGLREMVAAEGYTSLWRGLTLTLWRDVPFSAIYWWGYETGRDVLTDMREQARGRERNQATGLDAVRLRSRSRSKENHTATLVDSFVAGAASGAVAALITTPFDVGKTRQQVLKHGPRSAEVAKSAVPIPEDLPMPRFLWHIFKEQGMQGLFKGWAARCLKVAPACAIMISSYEVGKKMAGGINERKGEGRRGDEE
ncbi:mitochondrial carrier [Aulographum hederae CBS 113979]|uniref:Mitochondrial carrier n=1 Tax=Aulographum hederae CBS 113979 TaxID=1176131 RepID=A0A6G1H575_9PEZI|nr:mitochondrial carrier [Aulographum hederae CBS 113979]